MGKERERKRKGQEGELGRKGGETEREGKKN